MHATPWGLSGNFVAAMREGRGRLALAGPGDPTGRGAGFSFLRDDRKVSACTITLEPIKKSLSDTTRFHACCHEGW